MEKIKFNVNYRVIAGIAGCPENVVVEVLTGGEKLSDLLVEKEEASLAEDWPRYDRLAIEILAFKAAGKN